MPPRHAALAVCLAASALSGGCIAHVARVAPAPGLGEATVVVGSRVADPKATTTVGRGLPVDVPVTAWERRGGVMWRAASRVRTPLPWWQRFPFDAGSDLLPLRFECAATATLEYAPVAETSDAELADQARRHGFAHSPTDAP